MQTEMNTKTHTWVWVIGIICCVLGSIMLLLGLYSDAYLQFIIAIGIFVSYIFRRPVAKWKTIPLSIKLIFLYFLFSYILMLFRIYSDFESSDVFFGIFISFPLSILTKTSFLLAFGFLSIALSERSWRTPVLWVYGLIITHSFTGMLVLFLTPLSELAVLMGETLPAGIPAEAILFAKLFMLVPASIGLIISIIIWLCLFKKKEYFAGNSDLNSN